MYSCIKCLILKIGIFTLKVNVTGSSSKLVLIAMFWYPKALTW